MVGPRSRSDSTIHDMSEIPWSFFAAMRHMSQRVAFEIRETSSFPTASAAAAVGSLLAVSRRLSSSPRATSYPTVARRLDR